MKKIRNSYGFTLVELMLVVLLLTVIAGLTLPNFSRGFDSMKLKQTAKDLTYMMRYAQSRAITKNKHVRLVFEENYQRYHLEEENGSDNFVQVNGRAGRIFHIPSGIQIESDNDEILFFPDGQIEKLYVYICQREKCFTVSTKEQRGHALLYNERVEEERL
ncbi:MAG: prepilin-type N-terminal cleavage/methylation domain-containing protein [Candidatus Omnitrophica bacterium]|nr:prepilin-type N-terminal cleavage/methylation domain-containing protein [Candidatus Omnitrophota bacterium]MCB9747407.1 prepilin-type N-terminal cleavage/methylation domain-containing protein [Candidatus Omnitrophota bacterium]